jgi:hypothetical protein
MLSGTTIDNIVFGGPAWKVGSQLQPGDVILQVISSSRLAAASMLPNPKPSIMTRLSCFDFMWAVVSKKSYK